jgi:LuxR family transcriptional regulator, glucitol operon activator
MSNRVIATRLTCFALLSGVESDLRTIIRGVADAAGLTSFLPEDVRKNAARRWADDHKIGSGDPSVEAIELLDYADFADLGKLLYILDSQFLKISKETVHQTAETLIRLAPVRNRVCHTRPLEPDDFAALFDLAKEIIQKFHAYGCVETRATLERLQTSPAYVLSLVIPSFWAVDFSTIPHNLPLPEFDDTGFLGREKDRKEVTRLLLSPHPIVTVVGEGGLGKTALTLRCLYDLLELEKDNKYDAIIWVSLKTKMLTALGIEEIKNSIASTLGLVQNIATALGSPAIQTDSVEVLLQEIKDYMSHLKILLAIDNLETISPDLIRPLLSEVPVGSKVVITSRVGLGELELRYGLDPLDIKTAVRLARRYGQTLNLRLISELREDTLTKYCNWLHRSPLLIKWFVSSVAAGADPTKLLEKGGSSFESVVKFCFENLFERLSDSEREILHILASARRPLTQAELYFLTRDKRSDQVEWALNTLHHSSILKRTVESSTTRSEDPSVGYYISEFASEYIDRFAPPRSEVFSSVQDSLKQLRQMSEASALQRAAYKYDLHAAKAETRDQRICATYLRKALSKLRSRDIQGARADIADAKRLLPTYSESYRISALVESEAGELFAASRELEAAEQLDPTSPLVKYAYAIFQLKFLHDYESALMRIEAALRLDPNESALESVRALLLTRLGRFPEAVNVYETLLTKAEERSLKRRIELSDQAAECYRRWAELDAREKDFVACEKHIARGLQIVSNSFQSHEVDDELVRRFQRILDDGLRYSLINFSLPLATTLHAAIDKNRKHVDANGFELRSWDSFTERYGESIPEVMNITFVKPESNRASPMISKSRPTKHMAPQKQERPVAKPGEKTGRILRLLFGFGFLEDSDGKEWYFHRQDFSPENGWDALRRGQDVKFEIGSNYRGPCATKVRTF